ncbi:hypothetical protein [Streptomyces sp. NBC_00996]|nr:hypothetical protein OG390_01070 [Streptomyces sp. NBC_00996]
MTLVCPCNGAPPAEAPSAFLTAWQGAPSEVADLLSYYLGADT